MDTETAGITDRSMGLHLRFQLPRYIDDVDLAIQESIDCQVKVIEAKCVLAEARLDRLMKYQDRTRKL